MLINHDPEGKPELTKEMMDAAQAQGMQPVHVVCFDPKEKSAEGSMSYIALAGYIPRVGELIELSDGKICRVRNVSHKTSIRHTSAGKADIIVLVPSVIALLEKSAE